MDAAQQHTMVMCMVSSIVQVLAFFDSHICCTPRGQMCLVSKCWWCLTELEGESLCGFVCE